MIQTLKTILSPFRSWFTVDKRILGLYRIFLGILIFSDIFRRWDVRHIFYSINGIVSHSPPPSSINKSFSLLHTFNSSFEITLFFIVGMIFSIFLMFGYKTKLSHFIAGIILISIHNKVTLVENAGDFVLNCMIVWTFFLPLGSAISLDSLKYSLKNYPDYNANDLNRNTDSDNYNYSSIAYFAILFQISVIYFFTGLNKNGDDWINGTAIYYFYQLDTFLTPIGAFIRDYVGMTFSKIATFGTLVLEFITPILLFMPFYSRYFRLLAVILLTIFHLTISASLSIGLFSQTMIVSFILLLDGRILESIKSYLKRKNNKNYILFYDSDCGFCHYTARIIKRLDVLNRIIFADETFKDKPARFNNLITKTAIMYDQGSKKTWTRHLAFAKVISVIPFGFLISWIFYIPGISYVLGGIYDMIALKRTKISNLFGLPVCNIKHPETNIGTINQNSILFNNYIQKFKYMIIFCTVCIFLCSAVNYNLTANKSVNRYMEKADFEKFKYIQFLKPFMNYPRMIQRWDMFSPNVLKTDKWIIVEARLDNAETYKDLNNNGRWDNGEEFIDVLNGAWDEGEKFTDANSNEIYDEGEKFTDALNGVWDDDEIIDPFTGKTPVLDKIDYEILWKDINQFWRKYFGRIINKKGAPKLNHIKKLDKWIRRTDYFKDQIGDEKIKSIKIWYLTQRNSLPESTKEMKVRKKILFETKINKNRKFKNEKPVDILDIIKKNNKKGAKKRKK